MEIRHLRYFVAVAEELNFRRAAQRLNLSAPTLSVQIKQLEEELSVRLLERNTGTVALTAAGEFFLEDSKKILERIARMIASTRETAQGKRGVLRIGNMGIPLHEIISTSLNEFQKTFSNVDITFEETGVNQLQLEALMQGQIHIGFIFQNEDLPAANFRSFLMRRASVGVGLGAGHPLAQKRTISLKDLANERLLAIGPQRETSAHADFINATLKKRKIKAGPIRMASSPYAFFAMLAANQSVSIIGTMAGVNLPPGIVLRPIQESGDDLKMGFRMVWRKNEKSPLALGLIEILMRISGESSES